MSTPIDYDIFSTKYNIEEFFLYPLGKDDDEDMRIDFRGMYGNCELYENIFSPFLEFRVTVSDTIGILRNLPLRGGELLKVKFLIWTQKEPVRRTYQFRLVTWKKASMKDNVEVYNPMVFMSKQYFYDLSYRVNWAYPKQTPFKDIVDEMLKLLKIEEEEKELDAHPTNKIGGSDANQMTFTNITPLECIYRLIPFTNHEENNKLADFLFFECQAEENKIKFIFKSLNKLIEEAEEKWKFKFFPIQNSYSGEEAVKLLGDQRDEKTIMVCHFTIKDEKNNIKGIENSLAGGTVSQLNLLQKSFKRSQFDIDNLHKKGGFRLNDEPVYVAEKEKHFFTQPSEDPRVQECMQQYNMFKVLNYNVFDTNLRDFNSDIIRKFNYNVIDQLQINVICAGQTDLFLGVKTTFEIPEGSVVNEKQPKYSYETELKFLVVAIKHFFGGKDYFMSVALASDGEYTKEIYDRYTEDKQEWVKKVGDHIDGAAGDSTEILGG